MYFTFDSKYVFRDTENNLKNKDHFRAISSKKLSKNKERYYIYVVQGCRKVKKFGDASSKVWTETDLPG